MCDRRTRMSSSLVILVPLMLVFFMASCGQQSSSPDPALPMGQLTAADVQQVVTGAAASVNSDALVIAVTDREGNILALYRKPNAPSTSLANFGQQKDSNEVAVALARTASFFSNDQAPLSSRTVRFISGIHFPPGVSFTPNAALYGIENTNRGCIYHADFAPGQAVPPPRSIDGSTTGLGIITGKADVNDNDPTAVNPGGVPLFKNGHVVGGVGVTGDTAAVDEFAAFTGAVSAGFGPTPAAPGVVVIDGISLPFVNQTTQPTGTGPGTANGAYVISPQAGTAVPDGYLVQPRAGALGGLSATEVQNIVQAAISTANTTRAVIRLPLGSRARMAIAVADLDGTLLAVNRMPDATVFSIDVAITKARNMVYFSSPGVNPNDLPGVPPGTAVTNRTISFGAQPLFPPGIDGSGPGPWFNLYLNDVANPCTQGSQRASQNQSGIVFFPGSLALYRNGQIIGGLGVSGDGVDQDDFVTAGGATGYEAPLNIRADQIFINTPSGPVRLPYLKFPRNPTD